MATTTVDSPLREIVASALVTADPDRPAVLDGARTLTYGQLLADATTVARRLAAHEGPVRMTLPRGAAAITAQVACILAGRPFFPMDPARPSDRTEGPPDGAACGYLLTTSGTTGTPKVVRGSASGLANYLRWQRAELSLSPADTLTNTADPWFDFSLKETLGGIVAGATVAVVEPAALTHAAALLRRLADAQPTVVCLLPSRLTGLVDAMRRDPAVAERAVRRLRLLLVSGEPFPTALLHRWWQVAPRPTVLNLYGPTESTVIKLRHVMPPGTEVSADTVPVGRPIPGTDVDLLPTSELCLLSDDLALGYLGPETGATRFDRDAGGRARLYTGDLARLTPEGLVELCGRLDHTVKRRGIKVSLPAIESAALRHPDIRAAAAVPSGGRVVLFYTSAPGTEVTARAVRTALLDRLPPEQLPDQVREMSRLPLDARGKVDRASL